MANPCLTCTIEILPLWCTKFCLGCIIHKTNYSRNLCVQTVCPSHNFEFGACCDNGYFKSDIRYKMHDSDELPYKALFICIYLRITVLENTKN